MNIIYSRIEGNQLVENYLPRYSSGAFSNQTETFLYPNANDASIKYKSRQNGFPIKVNFILNIREEYIRELYARYFITNDGLISTVPYHVSIIRPNSSYSIDTSISSPLMKDIFVPNNSYYINQYNFNNFAINSGFEYNAPLNMVDNNWSPYIYRFNYINISKFYCLS